MNQIEIDFEKDENFRKLSTSSGIYIHEYDRNSIQTVRSRAKTYVKRLQSLVRTSIDLIRSLVTRIVFGVHNLIAIFMICYIRDELWYLLLSIGVVFLIMEWFLIAVKNKGKDSEWFSLSFFLYIITIIPPTWILELENVEAKKLTLQSHTPDNNGENGQLTETFEPLFDILKNNSKITSDVFDKLFINIIDSNQYQSSSRIPSQLAVRKKNEKKTISPNIELVSFKFLKKTISGD
jgi:hypothetical protein